MKLAYVSLVLTADGGYQAENLFQLDKTLRECARAHEIVIVSKFGEPRPAWEPSFLNGPVSHIQARPHTKPDSLTAAGLNRAVGDFVIEWRGPTEELTSEFIETILEPTNHDVELVEINRKRYKIWDRILYKIINSSRRSELKINKAIGRVYSRHALGLLLTSRTFGDNLNLLNAELPVQRTILNIGSRQLKSAQSRETLGDSLRLVAKGTKLGAQVPLVLSTASAFFGIAAAIYALAFLLLSGKTPAGWTTLMIVIGLGQSAILGMLGLIWLRLDSIEIGITGDFDTTSKIEVIVPEVFTEFETGEESNFK